MELSRLANRKYICTGINMYTAVDNGRKLDKTHWSSGIETWCNSKMQMLLKQDVQVDVNVMENYIRNCYEIKIYI